MTSEKFHRLFGAPPRQPESQLTQREMDLAASIQSVTEDVMLRMARHVRKTTDQKNLVLAGGVALNCVGNGKILKEKIFDQLFIQPASGDAGGALGAALFVWHQLLERPRTIRKPDAQKGSFLGPEWSTDEVIAFLKSQGAVFECLDSDNDLCDRVAELLAGENVVGWFQGRMEFGPRALGARSILGDARSPRMQSQMNLKIKYRESFRPFAPIVLQDHVHEYFEMEPGTESPYMLLVADVCELHRAERSNGQNDAFGIELLNQVRSSVPAVTHVDYSARVQTVDEVRNPLTAMLLRKFHERTGCPVLINTSFNVRSEPIVCSPEDAWRCFVNTEMDVLVLGRCVVLKSRQQNAASPVDRERHLQQFELD